MSRRHSDCRLNRRGRSAGYLAAALLLAGCTATTSGAVAPAGDLGHEPAPVQVAALDGLLLPPEQLDSVLQMTGLATSDSTSQMFEGQTTANDCAATWRVAWGPIYHGSGWTAVRAQYLLDNDNGTHKVWQAVVSFPMPVDANAFYAKQKAAWRTCNDRRLEERYVDDPPSPDSFWKLGQATDHDGMLTFVSAQEDSDSGWACERALTIRNNVAIDTVVCADHVGEQAEAVAKAIAQKVPVR